MPRVANNPAAAVARFAKARPFVHRLGPQAVFGFVLADGPALSGSSNQTSEGDIRRALIAN